MDEITLTADPDRTPEGLAISASDVIREEVETRALCASCASSMPFQWRQPLDIFSVGGCSLCDDTTASAQLFDMADPADPRPHMIARGVSAGDRVLFHTDDPGDPAGWVGSLEVVRIERAALQTFAGPVRYSSQATLSDGRTLDASGWHKIALDAVS